MPTRTAPDQPDGRRGLALVGIVLAVVWGLITHGTFAGSGDEPHYLMIAHSLAFDADLDLANNYRDARLIGGGTLEPEAHAVERSGRLRPVHDIGMPLALAPVVHLAYRGAEALAAALPSSVLESARLNGPLLLRHQMSLVMALLTGLLARELFLCLRILGGTSWSRFLWSLLCALTPPILSHSFLFFTEIPAALITLFVFRRLSIEPVRTAPMAVLCGALTGFLLLIHARNVGIVAGFALVAVMAAYRKEFPGRLVVAFVVALAAAATGRTVVNYLLWSSWITTPHAAIGAAAAAGEVLREIFVRGTGLLFDREYGLMAYGPIYLLAAPGLLVLARRRPPLARDLSIVVACYLIPVLMPLTNVHGWTGGWSPAARFLVPVVPLLWIAVRLYALAAAPAARIVIGTLLAGQVALNAFVWQFPKTLWNDGDGVSALTWTQWLPTWTAPAAAPPFALALGATMMLAYVGFRLTVTADPSGARRQTGPPVTQ